MTIRSLTQSDAASLLTFLNQNAEWDSFTPELLEENVWHDADFDADTTLIAEDGGHIIGFAMGLVRPATLRGYIKFLVTEKSKRRQGIAGQMLALLEPKLKAKGATVVRPCEANPNYFMPGVDVRYTAGWLFFQKHGYEKIGETHNLLVDLAAEDFDTSEAEASLAKRDIEVRRATADDRASVTAFLAQHFSAWQDEVAQAFLQAPIGLHLGIQNGEVLGFSAHSGNNIGTAWFGPMGTDPTRRGLGIGGVLLRRCLADQKAQGHTHSIIPWVGPIPFYAHYANAWIDRVFWRYEKPLA